MCRFLMGCCPSSRPLCPACLGEVDRCGVQLRELEALAAVRAFLVRPRQPRRGDLQKQGKGVRVRVCVQ